MWPIFYVSLASWHFSVSLWVTVMIVDRYDQESGQEYIKTITLKKTTFLSVMIVSLKHFSKVIARCLNLHQNHLDSAVSNDLKLTDHDTKSEVMILCNREGQ